MTNESSLRPAMKLFRPACLTTAVLILVGLQFRLDLFDFRPPIKATEFPQTQRSAPSSDTSSSQTHTASNTKDGTATAKTGFSERKKDGEDNGTETREFPTEKVLLTYVSPEMYQRVIQKAHKAIEPLRKAVYTDCQLVLLYNHDRKPEDKETRIKFRCGVGDNENYYFFSPDFLRDKPCQLSNLCPVVVAAAINNFSSSAQQQPNETSCRRFRVSSSHVEKNNTAILSLYDSVTYLRSTDNWHAFLNKVSYAQKSRRAFYVFLGKVDEEELNRHHSPADTFNAPCKDKKNTLNYNKAIAISALLHLGQNTPSTFFFLDADVWFWDTAYFGEVRLDNYFDLTPHAALLGQQYRKFPQVMNGGILGFNIAQQRQWVLDFPALWWQLRCGKKDQRALWLLLFADWSAATFEGKHPFGFNAEKFVSYEGARESKAHLMKWAGSIQASSPPTNSRHTGGNFSISGVPTAPLELPHVTILPSTTWVLRDMVLPSIRCDPYKPIPFFLCHARFKETRGSCNGWEACTNGKCSFLWNEESKCDGS